MVTDLLACSVCWGATQDPVVHGTKVSIVFLLLLTYLLLGGGIGMFVAVRRKALRSARPAHAAPAAADGAVVLSAPPTGSRN